MTIKQQAQQGVITPEIAEIGKQENVAVEEVLAGVASGRIAIPCNRLRKPARLRGIGKGLSTKVNVNLGTSALSSSPEEELRKLDIAVRYGADAVMDLSLGPQIAEIRREILERSPVMVGTVPIYQTGYDISSARRDFFSLTIDDFLATIERQAEEGVDFMTIHSGVTLSTLSFLEKEGRLLDVVSRGGSMLVAWMRHNRRESPLYEHFDDILDVLAAYDITLSLGDGMRPGAVMDATDRAQIAELLVLGELTQRARDKGVQVIIEGPGHVPVHDVEQNMRIQKSLCHDAPFYVLGPLVTDLAAGYDHIAAAIGGTLAALHGADFLCYVTPAEHLRLPNPEDVREGLMASRIAAHAADLALGLPAAVNRERAMATARKKLNWEEQYNLALDPEKARRSRESSEVGENDVCTMCGDFCAIKRINESEGPPPRQNTPNATPAPR